MEEEKQFTIQGYPVKGSLLVDLTRDDNGVNMQITGHQISDEEKAEIAFEILKSVCETKSNKKFVAVGMLEFTENFFKVE